MPYSFSNTSAIQRYEFEVDLPALGSANVFYYVEDDKTIRVWDESFSVYRTHPSDADIVTATAPTVTDAELGGITTTLSSNLAGSGIENISGIDNITSTQINSITVPTNHALVRREFSEWTNVSGSQRYSISIPSGAGVDDFIGCAVRFYNGSTTYYPVQKISTDTNYDNKWRRDGAGGVTYDMNGGAGCNVRITTYWAIQ
jgi:hypothetical protein